MESLLPLFPGRWDKGVDTITFYQGRGKGIYTEYYKKEKILGLFWPKEIVDKTNALQELLIGLECIAESGDLPEKLTASKRKHFNDKIVPVLRKCVSALDVNAEKHK